jgi:hypothetical protein
MRDHQGLVVREFKGLFRRGTNDVCPPGYLTIAKNLIFTNYGVKTRPGFTKALTLANIARIQTYKRIGEADRLLILTTDGKLWDSTNLVTPILNIPLMSDFSMISMFNRAYITPHNGVTGLPGEFLYVYGGSGVARKAGGSPPSGFTLGVANGAAGHIEKGKHLFAVVFETDTGYLTRPGPVNGTDPAYTVFDAPGDKKASISLIPIGPSGTVARRIVATAIIDNYNGDQKSPELFFVPNGRIANNTATGPLEYDFYDSELVDSADYLFDNLDNPPAFVGVNDYNGQLVGWGENGKESVVRVSKRGEPESFNGVEGFVVINPGDGQGLKYCLGSRGDLHCYKSQRHYMTRDNGQAPVFWPVIQIDAAIGTEPFGVAQVLDSKGQTQDEFIVASRSGILRYNGSYAASSLDASVTPLTYVIDDIWRRINVACMKLVQMALDPINKRLYVLIPVDGSTVINMMLVGDFQEGITPDKIKWSQWLFNTLVPKTIIVDTRYTDQVPLLTIGCSSNTYVLDVATNDDGIIIPDPKFELPFVSVDDEGSINHFAGARLRVVGNGTLQTLIGSLDSVQTLSADDIVMALRPGYEPTIMFNFQAEKASFMFYTSSIDEWFHVNKIVIFASKLWESRAL